MFWLNFEIFFNNLNNFINNKLYFSEEIVVLLIFYNFVKLIIIGSIVELIWPTHYFNKKNNINQYLIRFRTYSEFLLKLRPINYSLNVFNKSFLFFLLSKKKKKINFRKKEFFLINN